MKKKFHAQETNWKFNFFPPALSQMPFVTSLPHQYKWRDSKALNHLISSEWQIVTKNLEQPITCMQLKQGVHVYLLPSTPNSILPWLVVLMIKYALQKCKEINWILTAKTQIATNRKKTIVAAAISTISQSLIVDFSVKRKWERESPENRRSYHNWRWHKTSSRFSHSKLTMLSVDAICICNCGLGFFESQLWSRFLERVDRLWSTFLVLRFSGCVNRIRKIVRSVSCFTTFL